ncbi:MAG TPA: LamG-like jellyroll fold domain-containing protein [Hyphomicrobiaceae bacterium]|nr:LamG-like jellyroll fold domain-containing protein [Hyphomicrobiaceae bacterium]
MARNFNGSSDRIDGNPPVTNEPFTISCWFNSDNVTTAACLVSLSQGASSTVGWGLEARGDVTNDPVRARKGATAYAVTTTGFAAGAWHHACGVFAADNDRRAYLDGGGEGTDTANIADPVTPDRVSVGVFGDFTPSNFHLGRVAEVFVWNAALAANEILMLAQGAHPWMVRPGNIVFAMPLFGTTAIEPDWSGGNNHGTVTGAARIDHPDSISGIWPRPRRFFSAIEAAGGINTREKRMSAVGMLLPWMPPGVDPD